MKPEIEFIIEAIGVLCPNGGTWNGTEVTPVSDPVPTKAELDAQVEIQKAEYDAQEYARQRQAEYPSVGDQLDMLMKDMKNGTKTHQTACEAVKTKYPKG